MRIRHVARPAEAGQGMLEYILIVVFVAMAGIVVWRGFGAEIKKMIGEAKGAVATESGEVIKIYKDETK